MIISCYYRRSFDLIFGQNLALSYLNTVTHCILLLFSIYYFLTLSRHGLHGVLTQSVDAEPEMN